MFNTTRHAISLQDNMQILRDLSLLQIQMRDLEGYRVSVSDFDDEKGVRNSKLYY